MCVMLQLEASQYVRDATVRHRLCPSVILSDKGMMETANVYRDGKVLHDESPNASVCCDNVASSSVDVMKWRGSMWWL